MPCAVAVSALVHGVTWMLPNPDRRLLQRFHIDIQLASNLHSLLMNLSDKLRHQCFHRFFVLKWNVVVTLIACTYFNRDAILVESLDKVGTVTATTTSMNELMPLVKLAKARNEGRTTRLLLSQKVMMTAPRRRAPVPSLLHWCIFSVFYSKILFGCQQQKVPDAINLPSRSTQKLVRTCLVGCQQSTFWIFKLLLFISFFFLEDWSRNSRMSGVSFEGRGG
jgi:hypothetical protein